MADLIAQGAETQHRWRRTLPADQAVVLGRQVGMWSVPWDNHVSRQHAELWWRNGRLEVKGLPTARNPIFVRGTETETFTLKPGEHFVIGDTTFTLSDDQVNVSIDVPQPVEERTFSSKDLEQVRFRRPDHRIAVLSRLPDVISGATSDVELFVRLVNLLLAGIPRAEAVALVAAGGAGDDEAPVEVLHWDRRLSAAGAFRPSEHLIREALRNRQQSVLHVWGAAGERAAHAFTVSEDIDWAFCTPVRGEACRGWGIYVAGRFASPVPATPGITSEPTDLRDDLKFTELVAAVLSSLRQLGLLQRRQASLSQFFSPVVLSTLADQDPDVVLAPRETNVAVLFCDLRGFSRKSERGAGDLMGLLERVSTALGVMTHHILEHEGVVGDFQGDSAMGFWGWPLAQDDAVQRACLAALAIRREFTEAARRPGHPLAGFEIGIGIASGPAVAGKIGPSDQAKVTVFGPVVNRASRLEGMTKILRAPILLDEETARIASQQLRRERARCRRLAVVRPYGLDEPLAVSELLPPSSESPQLADEHLAHYEAALDAFVEGRWPQAYELLHRIPPDDRAKDFLTVFIAQHNRTAPAGWDGVIPLASKG